MIGFDIGSQEINQQSKSWVFKMTTPDNARAKKRATKPYKKTRIRLFSNGTCTVIGGKINFWFGLYPPPNQAPRALDVVTRTEI